MWAVQARSSEMFRTHPIDKKQQEDSNYANLKKSDEALLTEKEPQAIAAKLAGRSETGQHARTPEIKEQ